MRKTMMATAFGLALSLGAVGVASAQAGQEKPQRQEQGERGMRRRGPGGGELFKGISLTEDQKNRLKELRKSDKPNEQFRKAMSDARTARQRGDTATARAQMEALRPQMEQARERQFAAIRQILTPDQQKQFDANVASWKQKAAERQNGRHAGRAGAHQGRHSGAPNDR